MDRLIRLDPYRFLILSILSEARPGEHACRPSPRPILDTQPGSKNNQMQFK